MSSEDARDWVASRETTNLLLGTNIVVLAAGFVRLGSVGPWPIQWLSELLLTLVLAVAVALVVGRLFNYE
ncbi:hypothetical protein ACT4ML_00275 [Natrinema sp. LN54]|uniref:hypothetical protein n=1 Tax=Natrinema sp. LN54 TaxID=3458705 RepID=UPI004036A9C8